MNRIPVLDLKPQLAELKSEIMTAIEEVVDSTAFINGPAVRAFEKEVAAYLGVKHAVGVNSGTDALVIGLRALGIGPGDEVVTTPFSFFATAESISSVRATPVFVDIDGESFNLDPTLLEAAITPRTKAILPVHLFGRPAAMDQILTVADRHGLRVLEDCAQSIGARCKGQFTGTIGHAGAYSFFPSKNLGAMGDGGLLVSDDDEVADLARMLRNHGGRHKYCNEVLGYNSRLDSIQAAILRVKLPHLDAWNEGRREAAQRYNELLAELPGVIVPDLVEGHVFHQYTIRVLNGNRDQVHAALGEAGISCMVYYPTPQDELPVYEGHYPRLETNHRLAAEVLSLPIWPEITPSVQEQVVRSLRASLEELAKASPAL